MQTLDDFRNDFLRQINDLASENGAHPVETFISVILERFKDALGVKSQVEFCYVNRQRSGKFKSMRLDAASVDDTTFEANLFLADFDEKEKTTLSASDIMTKVKLLCNFCSNAISGAFNANNGSPEELIANAIRDNLEQINRIHLYIFTTNQISKRVKEYNLPSLPIGSISLELKLDVVDIERIYNLEEGPEELEIRVSDFNCRPIPCLKANLSTGIYDAYIAVISGTFLARIYKEYGAKLLKANVRSFLNMTGDVNKGIRDSIRKEPDKFFAYNNGISTMAKSINIVEEGGQLFITSFLGLQIINGGQTTASLALAYIKDKNPLDNIYIQMKLTILNTSEKELVRNIAKFANSQTKVTKTDLHSSHDYYVQLETLSRRIFAPVRQGEIKPTKWFFERTKKQYTQPFLTKTEAEKNAYKNLYPQKQKVTIEEAAKYLNLAELRPFDVAWGAQENANRFHKMIEKRWDEDNSFCNDTYFKELMGKCLLYKFIRQVISKAEWYKEKIGNLAQLVAYTFSKLVYEANTISKAINYMEFWQEQQVSSIYTDDVENAAKAIFDLFYDASANRTDVREYCKRLECWEDVKALSFTFSPTIATRLANIEL